MQLSIDEAEKSVGLATKFRSNLDNLIDLYGDIEFRIKKILGQGEWSSPERQSLLEFLENKLDSLKSLTSEQEQIFRELVTFIAKVGRRDYYYKWLRIEVITFIKFEVNLAVIVQKLLQAVLADDDEQISKLKEELIVIVGEYQLHLKQASTVTRRELEELVRVLHRGSITIDRLRPQFEEILRSTQHFIQLVRGTYGIQ